MGGTQARLGFRYQDAFLLLEVLTCIRRVLAISWSSGSLNPRLDIARCPVRFGVEAPTQAVQAVEWDTLSITDGTMTVSEVKSGQLKREDGRTLWRRLRREIAAKGNSGQLIVPRLVIDPARSEAAEAWRQLAHAAKTASSDAAVPEKQPARVDDGNTLLADAMWHLCAGQGDSSPPLPLTIASELLQRFELVEWPGEALEQRLRSGLDALFPHLVGETTADLLHGWLGARATQSDPAARQFFLEDLMSAVGPWESCMFLQPGQLADWRQLWRELRYQQLERGRTRLGTGGKSVDWQKCQPALAGSLAERTSNCVLLGEGGAGKTTLLNQLALAEAEATTLLLWAKSVTKDELAKVTDAVRFVAAIAPPSSAPRIRLFVDALDEAEPPLRQRWAQLLGRLAATPEVKAFVTVRTADWQRDGEMASQLDGWPQISLQMWPVALLTQLFSQQNQPLPPAPVLELLQRPIFLDLYWRTYVEAPALTEPPSAAAFSRHRLLREFWQHRLVNAPRHRNLGDVYGECLKVIADAAKVTGDFRLLDSAALNALLSEGVVVRLDGLAPSYQFRHPILRDFALAQWCLASGSAIELVDRWQAISSGISRAGALRALMEALAEEGATESSQPTIEAVVVRLLEIGVTEREVARALAACAPTPASNPAMWSTTAQGRLSGAFAASLVEELRLHGNGIWVEVIQHWRRTGGWVDRAFPGAFYDYAVSLRAKLAEQPNSPALRKQVVACARLLRRISEDPQFDESFNHWGRWLKHRTIEFVVPLLPDSDSLAWLEREQPNFSSGSREEVLSVLVFVAARDFDRARELYRSAVGLRLVHGCWSIEPGIWNDMLGHHAIEWSLGNHQGRPGLLERYPAEFLEPALQLAEALSVDHTGKERESTRLFFEAFKEHHPDGRSDLDDEEAQPRNLLDDNPQYTLWQNSYYTSDYERCLNQVAEGVARLEKESLPALLERGIPALQASRLASARSLLLDICIRRFSETGFAGTCIRALLAPGVFEVSGLAYWIQEALRLCWPVMNEPERTHVSDNLDSLAKGSSSAQFRRKQFLAALPVDALTRQQVEETAAHAEQGTHPFHRPERRSGGSFRHHPQNEEEAERFIGEWPPDFPRDVLRTFYRQFHDCIGAQDKLGESHDIVTAAAVTAGVIIQVALGQHELLRDTTRSWFLSGLGLVLRQAHRLRHDHAKIVQLPPTLLADAVKLGLDILEVELATLPKDIALGARCEAPGVWDNALELASYALLSDGLEQDSALNQRFEMVLSRAVHSGHPGLQRSLFTDVHPRHWFRLPARRELMLWMLLEGIKSPEALVWGLDCIRFYDDLTRAKVFRAMLQRDGAGKSEEFVRHTGKSLGAWGVVVFEDGHRSVLADVIRQILAAPGDFKLLQNPVTRLEFFGHVVFGMKEQLRGRLNEHSVIPDFVEWLTQLTHQMRALPHKHARDAMGLTMALHSLGCSQRKGVPVEAARPWWQAFLPLMHLTVKDFSVDEVHGLFFDQHDGVCNDLTKAEEVFELIEALLARIENGLKVGSLVVDFRDYQQGIHHSWRDCSNYAAEWLLSLRQGGWLDTAIAREKAFQLLNRLASEPLKADKALEGLHRFQDA